MTAASGRSLFTAEQRYPTATRGRARLQRAVWTGSDRLLAATAHAAIGFGFLGIGFLLSLAISAVIWLVSRRSPHVSVHAEQAGTYQLCVLAVNVVAVLGWVTASVVIFGRVVFLPPADASAVEQALTPVAVVLWLLVVPLFVLWYVGTIAYGLLGAVRVLLGYEFWYPIFGAWALRKQGRRKT